MEDNLNHTQKENIDNLISQLIKSSTFFDEKIELTDYLIAKTKSVQNQLFQENEKYETKCSEYSANNPQIFG